MFVAGKRGKTAGKSQTILCKITLERMENIMKN